MLSPRELESLTTNDAGRRITDSNSLSGKVRLRKGKVIVAFEYRYQIDKKTQEVGCGTWPDKSLKSIRLKRDEFRTIRSKGGNPKEIEKAERLKRKADTAEAVAKEQERLSAIQALQARIAVSELFERWATVELIRRKDGGKEVRRMFEKDVLPTLGTMAVEDVRKGHVTAISDALLARGVTRMAKLVFSLMRQMFRFAVDRDIIENDPTAAIRKAKIGGKDTERDRVLSDREILALRQQIPSARLLITTEAAIWLELSTGCRIGELLKAEWQHVRLESKEWFIPAENAKNGKAHTVFLSEFATRHFGNLQQSSGLSKWCFPNRKGNDHVCVKTVTKQIKDRQRGDAAPMSRRTPYTNALALPGGKWTPHDLRRTAATLMTALGVLPEVAEKCLNHTEESRVKRTYQRHSYEREKYEAWRMLGDRLDLLIRDDISNVIPLNRSA